MTNPLNTHTTAWAPVVRKPGWMGGVCAGMARRAGVDPVILRGLSAVAALLGLPVLWLYAMCWIALPDAEGRRPFGRGTARGPGALGVVVMLTLAVPASILPMVAWAGIIGYSLLQTSAFGIIAGVMVCVITVIPSLVLLTVGSSDRRRGWRAALVTAGVGAVLVFVASIGVIGMIWGAWQTSFLSPPLVVTGYLLANAVLLPLSSLRLRPRWHPATAMIEPIEPAPPADGELDGPWREQYEAWRIAHEEWKRAQADAPQSAAALGRAERDAFAAEYQRVREAVRRSRPRASAVYVAGVLGAALVVGSIVALLIWQTTTGADARTVLAVQSRALSAGAATAALLLAVGLVVAGVRRRRSGMLALLAAGAIGLASVPLGSFVISTRGWVGSDALAVSGNGPDLVSWAQYTELHVDTGATGQTIVTRGGGVTSVWLDPEQTKLDLDVRLPDGEVAVNASSTDTAQQTERTILTDTAGRYRWQSESPEDAPTLRLTIDQLTGTVIINMYERTS